MRKKYLLKDEDGFTLIEIIAVLVIMGILAAVAVPKFFDLQTRAREKAVFTALSEMKVRVNQHFASELLDGNTIGNIGYIAGTDIDTNIGSDFEIQTFVPGTTNISLTIKYPAQETTAGQFQVYSKSISLPKYTSN